MLGNTGTLKSTCPMPAPEQPTNIKNDEDNDNIQEVEPENQKKNYYKDSTLMLHESCYWF